MKETDVADAVLTRLRTQMGNACVDLCNLRQMTGGSVREIWAFDVQIGRDGRTAERRPMVFLGFRTAGPEGSLGPEDEFRLLEAAHAAAVPVPRPLFQGRTKADLPFYVMERIGGETLGGRVVRDERFARARGLLPAHLAAALAAIHRVPLTPDLAFLTAPPADQSPAAWEVGRLEDLYRLVTPDPHPAFELAFRWLAGNAPRGSDRALVHGDFRIGNLIVGEEGLRAVLDWELAHVCDPMEDLGWLCVRSWRFRADHLPMGGVGTREALFDAYAAATGTPVDPARVRFWEIFGNLRWGVLTIVQTRFFLGGASSSVELAGIGRRTAETEWELLNLLEGC
jgi:aminoglycoside phosphotransferase (APT) family kinase protein